MNKHQQRTLQKYVYWLNTQSFPPFSRQLYESYIIKWKAFYTKKSVRLKINIYKAVK